MKLTAGQIHAAFLALSLIINEKRNLPQTAKYRISRMYAALEKEGNLVEDQRMQIISELGEPVLKDGVDTGMKQVPVEKMAEFVMRWKAIADVECEVSVQPISITALGEEGGIEAAEFRALGDLITD